MAEIRDLPLEEQRKIWRARYETERLNPTRKKAFFDNKSDQRSIDHMDTTPDFESRRNLHTTSTSGRGIFEVENLENDNPSSSRQPFKIPKRVGSDIPSAYSDHRRKKSITTSTQGSIVPKSIMRPNNDSNQISSAAPEQYPFTEKLELPQWLKEAKIPSSGIGRDKEAGLQQLRTSISNCLRDRDNEEKRNEGFNKIRYDLHTYEYYDVTEALLKKTKLLDVPGLPQLFMPRKDLFEFPYDIRADARALHHKWWRHDFNTDLMRGLVLTKGKSRKSTSLQKDYPNSISPKYFGPGDLVSGQWWPILLASMRDGGHGSAEAGITRLGRDGATSVLISGSHYEDKDEGDVIYYCGTEGHENEMSKDTRALHDNIRTGNVVRVIRSAKLPLQNRLRPAFGFRYDGVYKVLSYEVLDESKHHHRFFLRREPNQDPIRWTGIGARPTAQDMEAYHSFKDLSGM